MKPILSKVGAVFSMFLPTADLAGGEARADGRRGEWKLAVNGHARTMVEVYRGIEFGLGAVDDEDWVHQRFQAMGLFENGDSLQLAMELTWGRMWGKEAALAPPDEDELDFLQVYAQMRIPMQNDALEIRAGRQTLYYGSGRLLASREGANQRLAHDALRISWLRREETRVDLFIASPVEVKPEAFDNTSHPGQVLLWSIYAVMPLSREAFADFYYIGFRNEDSIFAVNGQPETRHTFGIRNWNKDGPLTYNTELIIQIGEVDDRDILAGAASIEIGSSFAGRPWKPALKLRADAISGGGDADTIHTFHPLFQANNYFNEGGFLAPSNLINVNPLITLHPRENLRVSMGVNFQWVFSTRDAIYGPPLQRLGQPEISGNRYLGTALNASVEWEFSKGASFFLGCTHHHAGRALTGIGGTDGNYLQASLRFEF